MTEYKKTLTDSPRCPCCGASMSEFKQSLSKGIVTSLVKFATIARIKRMTNLHLVTDLELETNAHNNFQKLRYFGLVEKTGKPGLWEITSKGLNFVAGRVAVEDHVITFRNKTQVRSNTSVFIDEILRDQDREYWQKEFPVEIVFSKIVPLGQEDVQQKLI